MENRYSDKKIIQRKSLKEETLKKSKIHCSEVKDKYNRMDSIVSEK